MCKSLTNQSPGISWCVMAVLIFIALAIGVHNVASIGQTCPSSDWMYRKGTCYLVPGGPKRSWFDGRELCQSLGGDLVRPKSQDENDFIQQTVTASYDGEGNINGWVRCYLKDNERACSNDAEQYTNWGAELNDIGKCAVMIYFLGSWRGLGCSEERQIMCEARPGKCAPSLSCRVTPHDQPRCLTNHTIAEFRMKSPLQCCITCSQDQNCRSFNLVGVMCQLNRAIISEVHANFSKTLKNCVYYEYTLK